MNRKALLLVAGVILILVTGCPAQRQTPEGPEYMPQERELKALLEERAESYYREVSQGMWMAAVWKLDPKDTREYVTPQEYHEVNDACNSDQFNRDYRVVSISIPIGNPSRAYLKMIGSRVDKKDLVIDTEWKYSDGQWHLVLPEDEFQLYKDYGAKEHVLALKALDRC